MLAIGKFENKAAILAISFLVISIIGFIDYLTTAELTLSYFYIIPISIHALYKGTTKFLVIINSVFGCLVWTLVIISNNYYSNGFYTVWNALIILAFFLTSGLLLWTVKKKYKENQELLSHLARLNEEKNKFIGIAAHDMKNPVSTIHSFSEILLSRYQKELNPDLLKIIGYIREVSHDALILLGNLLNISVIESGKINIKYKMQDYIEFLKKSIYLNQIIADQKEIVIKLETGEHQFFIKFDEHYLSEVVNNLLSNAIKFSSPKSEVLIKVTKSEKNSVLTEIIDKGRGVPEEEQIKLFNYFQKTSTLPTAGEVSTGLGLAIARKIILEHHGSIGVKSAMNVGSNFYYELF